MEQLAATVRDELAGDLPDGEDDLTLLVHLYALLAAVKGEGVTDRDVHDAWSVWMALRGEDHPAAVPFDELPAEVQAEDRPFAQAIQRAARGTSRR